MDSPDDLVQLQLDPLQQPALEETQSGLRAQFSLGEKQKDTQIKPSNQLQNTVSNACSPSHESGTHQLFKLKCTVKRLQPLHI